MKIQESAENYLEAILMIQQQKGHCRSIDVAQFLSFSKPSVSRAVGLLKSGGLIQVDADGYITLTEDGAAVAKKVYERHTVLSACLVQLGVDKETADADACKIEHVISDTTFDAIKRHIHRT